MTGSNRRHFGCKPNAIPTELIPHLVWWTLADSNRSPPACKAGALPDELRARIFRSVYYRPFSTERLVLGPVLEDLLKLRLAQFCDSLLVVVETSAIQFTD